MLPRVSGNSPSTLCRLLIEFVLVIEFVNKIYVVLMILKSPTFTLLAVFVDYYDDDYLRMLVLMTMMIVVMMIAAMVMMLKARTCCPSCFQRGIEPSKLPWRRACVVYYGYHGINMMMLVSIIYHI